jgi:TetR/AcrR family acrAB operon transcriptional repressor
MRRTKEEAAVTRETILDAAMQVFCEKGYAAATLDDIARAAEVTRGAIYWHFDGKPAVYNSLVQERFGRAFAHLGKLLAQPGTPLERLRRLLVWQLAFVEENAEYRAVLELTLLKTVATPELAEGMARKAQNLAQMRRQLAELIDEAKAAGELRNDVAAETAALAALGMTSGVTSLWLLDPHAFSIRAQAEPLAALLLSGWIVQEPAAA